MPTLKQVTCSIELGPSNTRLKEYGHRYTDGGVEAFIAVPESDIPFRVHITSNGYIAPGLAAYLFIDGQYQCNRNRQKLQTPSPGMDPREYEVDFKLRQREEKTSDGLFVAREWSFSKLATANADTAPNINPNFTKNVGTIEVVLLRCKGGGVEGSTEYLTDTAGAPAAPDFIPSAKSPSVRNVAAADKAPSKAPSRAPSKVASQAPSKKASEAGGSIGGLFGLFDGAGDRPGHPSYTPRYSRDPQPSPGYRAYRDDRYEPRPYTVHGGRADRAPPRHEYEDAYDPRPRTAAGHYPYPSPMGGYDFQHRRWIDSRHQPMPEPSPPPPPMERVVYPRSAQLIPRPRHNPVPEGFQFIQELCQQIDGVLRLQFEETRKRDQLQQDANMNRHDPEVHLAAVKAARAKEQALGTLQEEANALWSSLVTRMNRMDEPEWNFARDYVVLEKRLVPMSHPHFQQWRDPRLQQYSFSTPNAQSGHAGGEQDQGWEEVGQGETGGLYAMKRAQLEGRGRRNTQNAQDDWNNNNQNNNGWTPGAPVDELDRQADAARNRNNGNDGWNNDNKSNNNGGGWGNDNKSNKGGGSWNGGQDNKSNRSNGSGWGDNNNNNDNNGNDGWDQKSASRHSKSNRSQNKSQSQGWGNNNDNNGAGGGWSGGNDDNKSQSAKSKVQSWNNDGGGGGGGGWGDQDNNKAKSQKSDNGWGGGSKAASKHPSRTSRRPDPKDTASTICEPVIKPYWADWDKPPSDTTKPRAKPREPYEYPALAPPIAPSGKASSVGYGVQAGRGANYAHQTYRPEYLDTMQKPYAIFTFKYRSQKALERILKRRVEMGDVARAVVEAEKENLMKMPKDELVSNMMRMKMSGGGGGKGSEKPAEKAASKAASKKDGWGTSGGGGGGGWGDGGNDEVKPSDSASQWGGNDKNDDQNKQDGWGGNNDNGGGGGGGWGADDKKTPSRKSNAGGGDGWGGGDNAGGDNSWGNNDNAGGGGGGGWDNKTEEHFAGDPDLQNAGGGGW